MRRMLSIIICSMLFLSGCWSSQELEETALVQGVGLNASGDQLKMSVEIVKPTEQGGQGSGGGSQSGGEHVILDKKADTLLEGARGLIRHAKRRLDFGHTRVWILGKALAKEDFVHVLDSIRRDQMLRLSSFLFISNEKPSEIMNTTTLYEDLTSIELVSGLEQTQFIAEYSPIKYREFYELIEGPVPNAYIPIISMNKSGDQSITSIDGTAVIKDHRMAGELNVNESMGLNWLLDHVKSGSVYVSLDENEKVSLEISRANTKIKPRLNDNQLDVNIETTVEGTLSDNVTTREVDEAFINEVEKKISNEVENTMRSTLNKLQKQLHADITGIGLKTYRTYPKQWKHIRSEWDTIFSNADITIDVTTEMTHRGLINESVKPNRQKPYNNPYPFSK